MQHDPRHQYDCERCKFAWCCEPHCGCVLRDRPKPPIERALEVEAALSTWRAENGHHPGLTRDEKKRLGLVR